MTLQIVGIDLELKFEPRDLWVGLFWDRKPDGFHVFFCPVPTVAFHLAFLYPTHEDAGQ